MPGSFGEIISHYIASILLDSPFVFPDFTSEVPQIDGMFVLIEAATQNEHMRRFNDLLALAAAVGQHNQSQIADDDMLARLRTSSFDFLSSQPGLNGVLGMRCL